MATAVDRLVLRLGTRLCSDVEYGREFRYGAAPSHTLYVDLSVHTSKRHAARRSAARTAIRRPNVIITDAAERKRDKASLLHATSTRQQYCSPYCDRTDDLSSVQNQGRIQEFALGGVLCPLPSLLLPSPPFRSRPSPFSKK